VKVVKRLFVLMLITFSAFAFSFTLKDVQFDGLKAVTKDELLPLYQNYLGKDVNENAINAIISSIDETGYFESIDYELVDDSATDTKILKIRLVENAPVKKVSIEINGPGIISVETLQSSITLLENKPFSFTKFWESIDKIASAYSSQGYMVATPRSQDKSFAFIYVTGSVGDDETVTFKVNEYVLYDVNFEIVSQDDEFKKEFETIQSKLSVKKYVDYEKKDWFMKIFDSEKDYVMTLQSLQTLFQDLTKYIFVKIVNVSTEEVESKYPAKVITLTVTDNTVLTQPVYLKGIKTKGNTLFTQNELIGETSEGTYTNLAVLKKMQDVKDKYDKAGYFIDLNLEAGDDNTINILITELKVRNVKVEGNSVTKDYVFNDLIYVKPGDFLKRDALQLTYTEIYKSNFFDSVDFNIQPVENDNSLVDVAVVLTEKAKKFDFQGGIVYAPVTDSSKQWWEGFGGTLSLSTTNPTGNGENVSLNFQRDFTSTQLSFTSGIRKPFEWPVILSGSVDYQGVTSDGTTTTNVSYSAGLNTLKTQLGQFGISVKYEDTTESSSTSVTSSTLSFPISYVYETLDSLYVPMKGYSFSLTGTKYLPISINGSDALSYSAELTLHFPLTKDISFASRVLAGQVFQTSGKEITYSLAGLNQVRGVKTSLTGSVIGLTNNEIRFKQENSLTYFSLFYDAGFVSNDYDFQNIEMAFGAELGINVPLFGLLRLGFGVPVNNPSQPNTFILIGKTF